MWTPTEQVVAYYREGDEENILEAYRENNCETKKHPAGYRSIHYIISTQPTLRKIHSEIQVRTIFEEGWSEIDHKVRYPDFSDNELISYFLTIFNRMAGNADEMGSFVRNLTNEVSINTLLIKEHRNKQDEYLARIEELAYALSAEKDKNHSTQEAVTKLKSEVNNLRKNLNTNNSNREAKTLSTYINSLAELNSKGVINKEKSIYTSLAYTPQALQHAAIMAKFISDTEINPLATATANLIAGEYEAKQNKTLADYLSIDDETTNTKKTKSIKQKEPEIISNNTPPDSPTE